MKYTQSILWLSIAGFLFSGYLSATKFLTSGCAFNESCPQFLGYPACYFGFAIFSVILAASFISLSTSSSKVRYFLSTISMLGIMYASYIAIPEINALFSGAVRYQLGLSTCTYGFFVFIAIFVLSFRSRQI